MGSEVATGIQLGRDRLVGGQVRAASTHADTQVNKVLAIASPIGYTARP